MQSTSVAPERGTPAPLAHTHPVSPDLDDLIPELQSTLSALTALELRHEIELDCLEEWSCPGDVKQTLLTEREREYQQARTEHLERLARLQERVRGSCSTQ